MSRRPRVAVRLLAALLSAFVSMNALAETDAVDDASAAAEVADSGAGEAEGGIESGWRSLGYGVAIGYGAGIAPRSRQRGRDVANVQVLTFEPQIRMLLARAGDGSAWYHGEVDGTLEGLLMFNFSPRSGVAGGATAGLRYTFLTDRRIQPFAEGAVGIGGLDFDLAGQDDGFSFFIQAGAGARYVLHDDLALVGSLRWQHISNAQTHLPNNGIDTIGFRIGIEIW